MTSCATTDNAIATMSDYLHTDTLAMNHLQRSNLLPGFPRVAGEKR